MPRGYVPGEPTDAEVAAAHLEYISRLRQLFETHKGALGYGERTLIVT